MSGTLAEKLLTKVEKWLHYFRDLVCLKKLCSNVFQWFGRQRGGGQSSFKRFPWALLTFPGHCPPLPFFLSLPWPCQHLNPAVNNFLSISNKKHPESYLQIIKISPELEPCGACGESCVGLIGVETVK